MDKNIQAGNPAGAENLISAAAQNDTGACVRIAQNYRFLDVVNGILHVGIIYTVGQNALEERAGLGNLLLFLLDRLSVIAAGSHRLPNDIFVVKLNSQLLGHPLSNGMSSGTIFPADGNNFVHVCPPVSATPAKGFFLRSQPLPRHVLTFPRYTQHRESDVVQRPFCDRCTTYLDDRCRFTKSMPNSSFAAL